MCGCVQNTTTSSKTKQKRISGTNHQAVDGHFLHLFLDSSTALAFSVLEAAAPLQVF